MKSAYMKWNDILAAYFVQGVPQGTPVYLGVTDQLLIRLGSTHLGLKAEDCLTHFQDAVVGETTKLGRVLLSHLRGRNRSGFPGGTAFLALCVLAAYRMGKEQALDAKDYFTGLKELLKVPSEEGGRPAGMKAGAEAEEPLWREWNSWLVEQGFIPTASKKGDRHISYPISQALLRSSDERKLEPFLRSTFHDGESLVAHLVTKKSYLTHHVQRLLEDVARASEVKEALFQCYERQQLGDLAGTFRSKMVASVYRKLDRYGEVTYLLYPRQKAGVFADQLLFEFEGDAFSLEVERPGWYQPEFVLEPQDFQQGLSLPVKGSVELDALVFPRRTVWVLVQDEYLGSGSFAGWGAPNLGLPFVVLLSDVLERDFKMLKHEGLISWEQQTVPFEGWTEFTGCRITAGAGHWRHVQISRPLLDALRPRRSMGVHFVGGLRVQGAWMTGMMPAISVVSDNHAHREGTFELLDSLGNLLQKLSFKQGEASALKEVPPGHYEIKITIGDESLSQFLVVRSWDDLEPFSLVHHLPLVAAGTSGKLQGAIWSPA